jgi:hypothetical protein
MLLDLYFYMIVIITFFSIKFSNEIYGKLGFGLLVAWTALFVYYKGSLEPFANFKQARQKILTMRSEFGSDQEIQEILVSEKNEEENEEVR